MAFIGTMLKSFILSLVALVAPYLIKGLMTVVIPLLLDSLNAVFAGEAAITAAKQKVKESWKSYVKQARADAAGTASLIDDWLFGYLEATELDDAFIEKLFNQAIELERGLLRLGQGAPGAPAPGN